MKGVSVFIFVFTFIIFLPDTSYAWGPAMHIHLAMSVLDNLSILPLALQGMLQANRYDFIYGNISADIITGKKFTQYAKHCHNWHIGMKVLDKAETDSQKAFAYGYLCHLAADVVAHNYYVPNQTIATFNTRTLNHAYWEIRFDSYIEKSVWKVANKVAKEMHKDNDPLLRQHVDNTLFSFRTNKRIFNGMLMIGRVERWHRMVDLIAGRSRWKLDKEDVLNYERISLDSMLAFLIDGKKARCCKADPAGRKSLKVAADIRKKLKLLKKRGRVSDEDCQEIFKKLRPHFKKATVDEFNHFDIGNIII